MNIKAETVSDPTFLIHRLLGATDLINIPIGSCWQIVHEPEGPALRAYGSGAIRLGGLFDIFPESYWSRFTVLRNVTLRCHVAGPITIRLLRRMADGSREYCLKEWRVVDSMGATDVCLTTDIPASDAPESYLLVEVIAESAGASLKQATWETNQFPICQPCLGVAITTYNRETFLIANLERLRGRLAGGRIVIVNHGEPGLADRIGNQIPSDPDIRYIDQENSGGAGGFTRAMLEHRATGDITHVLLMDDDIDLQEDIVERLTAILSFANPEFCLGGAMLDYYKRNKLFTAGDFLKPGSFGIGHVVPQEGCDILETRGVDFLSRIHRPDFNGWWCFVFPISALDEVGLPMPCFIRGDDIEFGYRLMYAGKPTLGWPGIAVWHMPFADKSAPWHMFYDRRNGLFLNARYRRVGRLAALGNLLGGFIHHFLRYDYDRVRAMTLGVAAFNRGAQSMIDWTHRDHASLIALTRPRHLGSGQGEGMRTLTLRRLTGFSRSFHMTIRFLSDLLWPWRDRIPVKLPPGEVWRPDGNRRPAVVAELNGEEECVALYSYSWRESWKAVIRCSSALVGLMVRFYQAAPLHWPDDKTSFTPIQNDL